MSSPNQPQPPSKPHGPESDAPKAALDISWLGGGSQPADPDEAHAQALALLAQTGLTNMGRLNALLEIGPQMATLPSTTVHRAITEIGLHDALPLIEICSNEQVRELVDLDAWRGDRVDPEGLLDWLHALTTLSDERVAWSHLRGLDIELLAHLVRTRCRIYLAADEDAPDEPEGTMFPTPDGWFVLDLLCESSAETEQLIALLEYYYRQDADEARRLLQNVMWELPSDLEEEALRWRLGRLQDMGFANPFEALVVYSYLDPRSVVLTEDTRDTPPSAVPDPRPADPSALVVSEDEAPLLAAALEGIDDPAERQRLATAMLWLANRTLSADGIHPADLEGARTSLRALRCRLSLGLDHLSAGNVERARDALMRIALLRIARLGHSLVIDLARPVLKLARLRKLGRQRRKLDLLPEALEGQLQLLIAPRPQLLQGPTPRPFCSRRDLEIAAAWVEQAQLAALLVPRNSLPADAPDTLRMPDCFCTAVFNAALGREGAFDTTAFAAARALVGDGTHRSPQLLAASESLVSLRLVDAPEQLIAGQQLARAWLGELCQHLAALAPEVELRFVGGLWFEL